MDQLQTDLARQLGAPVAELQAHMVRQLTDPIAELQRSLVAQVQLNMVREAHLTMVRQIKGDIVRQLTDPIAELQRSLVAQVQLNMVREAHLTMVRQAQVDMVRQLAAPVADLQRSILGQLTVNFQFKVLAQLSQTFGFWNTQAAMVRQFFASPASYAKSVAGPEFSSPLVEHPAQMLGEVGIPRSPLVDSTINASPAVPQPSWLRQHDTEVIVTLAALTFLIAFIAWLFPQQSTSAVSPSEVQQIVKSILKAETSGSPAPHSCHPSDRR